MTNAIGGVSGLTLLTPIIPGREPQLEDHLAALPVGEGSPLARVPTVHFARWVIIPQLVYQGPPQKPDGLKSQYLLFTSCVDGSLERFVEDMRTSIPDAADAIWGHCAGYPGAADVAGFRRYFEHNRLDNQFFVAAYPDASVAEVRESVAFRDRFVDFAVQAQTLPPAQLRDAFRRTFVSSGASVEAAQ